MPPRNVNQQNQECPLPLAIVRIEGSVMPVNSYVIDAPAGAVVVDGQLTRTDGAAVAAAVAATGKPLSGVVLTHGHPDHYAATSIIVGGADVPIIATAMVDEIIRSDDALKDQVVAPMMGDQWPTHRVFPNQIVNGGDVVEVAGIELRVEDLGPGESKADSVWFLDDTTVFVGDIAYNDMHAYLLDGHYDEWLATLTRLESDLAPAAVLHVGHGRPAGIELLGAQRRYIEAFLSAVDANLDADAETRAARVTAAMRRLVAADDLLFLMQLSIEPIATLLAASHQ
jgi:glyoxylase-like metal-dependent hydrolase (beta-lactamase superfamily II)